MADKFEQWQTYVEKEKTRELLNEAMKATPIRDQWRQIIVVTIAVAVIAGAFVARTKRFKEVMAKIERSIEEKHRQRLAANGNRKNKTAAMPLDPEKAIAKAEVQWEHENATRGTNVATDGDGEEIQAHITARQNLGSSLEKLSEQGISGLRPTQAAEVAPMEREVGRTPASSATVLEAKRVISEALPAPQVKPDTIGIGGGEIEPDADLFNLSPKPHSADYRTLNMLPPHYVRERDEFPDLR